MRRIDRTRFTSDFEGDGLPNYAIYNLGTGVWYVHNPSTNTFSTTIWGAPGDKVVHKD